MKWNIINLIISAGLLLAFSGCAKERPDVVVNNTSTETQVYEERFGPIENATGVLVGKIVTKTKYSLFLYNESFKSDMYIIDLRTGYFVFKDLKPGSYTLLINPADPAYEQVGIQNIKVADGQITNLGLINLN